MKNYRNGSVGVKYIRDESIRYNKEFEPYLTQGYEIVGKTFHRYDIFRLNGSFEYCDPWNVRDKRLTKHLL